MDVSQSRGVLISSHDVPNGVFSADPEQPPLPVGGVISVTVGGGGGVRTPVFNLRPSADDVRD